MSPEPTQNTPSGLWDAPGFTGPEQGNNVTLIADLRSRVTTQTYMPCVELFWSYEREVPAEPLEHVSHR